MEAWGTGRSLEFFAPGYANDETTRRAWGLIERATASPAMVRALVRAVGEIEQFLTGARHSREPDRALATVMFTDIVGSTRRASEIGDRRWRELLETHDEGARRQVAAHGGRVVMAVHIGARVASLAAMAGARDRLAPNMDAARRRDRLALRIARECELLRNSRPWRGLHRALPAIAER